MFYLRQRLTQSLSGLISVALIATSSHVVEAASLAAPDVLERFAPARGNGFITDLYHGSDARTVILIQDLHLHYPTQQRIVKILDHLYSKGLATGPLAIEGIEGPYDTSKIASYPEGKIKSELVDYFMKKGELSAPEAFSVLRGDGHLLYGVDKAQYYDLNRNLFKESRQDRNALRAQLTRIQSGLALLKRQNYPRALRRLDKEEAYGMASAEKLLNDKLQICPNELTRNLVTTDHMLRLTQRLVRQKVTLEEARYIAQRLPAFVSLTNDLLKADAKISSSSEHSSLTSSPAVSGAQTPEGRLGMPVGRSGGGPIHTFDVTSLQETLKSAVDFYVVALMRDGPLAENTLALIDNVGAGPHARPQPESNSMKSNPNFGQAQGPAPTSSPRSLVLVVGGFHTAGLTKAFKKAGVSYVVITPAVPEAPDAAYREMYERRLSGEHASEMQVASDLGLAIEDETAASAMVAVIADIPFLEKFFARMQNAPTLYRQLGGHIRRFLVRAFRWLEVPKGRNVPKPGFTGVRGSISGKSADDDRTSPQAPDAVDGFLTGVPKNIVLDVPVLPTLGRFESLRVLSNWAVRNNVVVTIVGPELGGVAIGEFPQPNLAVVKADRYATTAEQSIAMSIQPDTLVVLSEKDHQAHHRSVVDKKNVIAIQTRQTGSYMEPMMKRLIDGLRKWADRNAPAAPSGSGTGSAQVHSGINLPDPAELLTPFVGVIHPIKAFERRLLGGSQVQDDRVPVGSAVPASAEDSAGKPAAPGRNDAGVVAATIRDLAGQQQWSKALKTVGQSGYLAAIQADAGGETLHFEEISGTASLNKGDVIVLTANDGLHTYPTEVGVVTDPNLSTADDGSPVVRLTSSKGDSRLGAERGAPLVFATSNVGHAVQIKKIYRLKIASVDVSADDPVAPAIKEIAIEPHLLIEWNGREHVLSREGKNVLETAKAAGVRVILLSGQFSGFRADLKDKIAEVLGYLPYEVPETGYTASPQTLLIYEQTAEPSSSRPAIGAAGSEIVVTKKSPLNAQRVLEELAQSPAAPALQTVLDVVNYYRGVVNSPTRIDLVAPGTPAGFVPGRIGLNLFIPGDNVVIAIQYLLVDLNRYVSPDVRMTPAIIAAQARLSARWAELVAPPEASRPRLDTVEEAIRYYKAQVREPETVYQTQLNGVHFVARGDRGSSVRVDDVATAICHLLDDFQRVPRTMWESPQAARVMAELTAKLEELTSAPAAPTAESGPSATKTIGGIVTTVLIAVGIAAVLGGHTAMAAGFGDMAHVVTGQAAEASNIGKSIAVAMTTLVAAIIAWYFMRQQRFELLRAEASAESHVIETMSRAWDSLRMPSSEPYSVGRLLKGWFLSENNARDNRAMEEAENRLGSGA